MKNIVYIAQSLDGYIAGKNEELDWLDEIENPEQNDLGWSDFMSSIDALLMGKNTFKKITSFGVWPYEKPVFVLSNSLNTVPSGFEGKVELIKGDLKAILERVHKKGYKNLYIDGGKLIQSFLKEDMIDEMVITTIPTLLGGGISLFGDLEKPIRFKVKSSELLLNQIVKTHYILK